MTGLQKTFEKKPYLAWYVKNKTSLSDKSVLEHILNYGNWEDFKEIERIIGLSRMRVLFKQIVSGKRVNLKPRTINYFENYFRKYA